MLEYLVFSDGGFCNGYRKTTVRYVDHQLVVIYEPAFAPEKRTEQSVSAAESTQWIQDLEGLHIERWASEYQPFCPILDGEQWEVQYKRYGKRCRHIAGNNAYPLAWLEFLHLMNRVSPIEFLDSIEERWNDEAVQLSPIPIITRYLDLLFAVDSLWYRFSAALAPQYRHNNAEYIPRTTAFRDSLYNMITMNMGGGIPLSIWEQAACCILRYQQNGHDIDAETDNIRQLCPMK